MNLLQRVSAAAALTAIFISTPAMAQKVETDYDHSVNFTRYHTYCWGHLHSSDPFYEDRIRSAVDQALQAKEWRAVREGCDVTLTAVLIKKSQAEYTTFYNALGGGWRWHGWGTSMATTEVEKIPVGTLVVDIYDTSSEHLVWARFGE